MGRKEDKGQKRMPTAYLCMHHGQATASDRFLINLIQYSKYSYLKQTIEKTSLMIFNETWQKVES